MPIKPSTGWGTRRYAPTGIRVSRAVPRTPVTSVIVLAPLKRSWAPFTGRGAQAGSPTRSAGQVGPAITVTVNDPKCPARVDWPQPAAMTTRPQIASRCLTSVSDPPERSVVPADLAEDARRWASRSGLACADSSVDALDSACATGSRPARWWVRAQTSPTSPDGALSADNRLTSRDDCSWRNVFGRQQRLDTCADSDRSSHSRCDASSATTRPPGRSA